MHPVVAGIGLGLALRALMQPDPKGSRHGQEAQQAEDTAPRLQGQVSQEEARQAPPLTEEGDREVAPPQPPPGPPTLETDQETDQETDLADLFDDPMTDLEDNDDDP